jgi:hypothetical protein
LYSRPAPNLADKWDKELAQLQTVTGIMERVRYIRLLEDNEGDVGTVVGILLSAPLKWEKELQQLRGLFGQIDEVQCVQLLDESHGDVYQVATGIFEEKEGEHHTAEEQEEEEQHQQEEDEGGQHQEEVEEEEEEEDEEEEDDEEARPQAGKGVRIFEGARPVPEPRLAIEFGSEGEFNMGRTSGVIGTGRCAGCDGFGSLWSLNRTCSSCNGSGKCFECDGTAEEDRNCEAGNYCETCGGHGGDWTD